MVAENPTWGAPRIEGELLMLGFEVSELTVSRTDATSTETAQPLEALVDVPAESSRGVGWTMRLIAHMPKEGKMKATGRLGQQFKPC